MCSCSICDSVSDISSRSLTRSDNLHHLSSRHSKILGNGVAHLNFGQLVLFDSVFVQKFLGVFIRQNGVFWHHLVVSDIHLEVRELDDLDWHH